MKRFDVHAAWDQEAGIWWATSDSLPLTTEAASFDQLVERVLEIAPEIAEMNGHVSAGEQVEIHVIGERVQSVSVPATV